VFGRPGYMLLYMLGGLGPTLAAYIAMLAAPARSPLKEFHARLFHWRVSGGWYVVGLLLPVALALAAQGLAVLVQPCFSLGVSVWSLHVSLLFFCCGGGGGGRGVCAWRGAPRPEVELPFARPAASGVVGAIFPSWPLALFFSPALALLLGMALPRFPS